MITSVKNLKEIVSSKGLTLKTKLEYTSKAGNTVNLFALYKEDKQIVSGFVAHSLVDTLKNSKDKQYPSDTLLATMPAQDKEGNSQYNEDGTQRFVNMLIPAGIDILSEADVYSIK